MSPRFQPDTIGVLTSGGDAPGMNAAVRAVAKTAASHGVAVWGVENGFDGLIDGRLRPLTVDKGGQLTVRSEVEYSLGLGGTFLGSARSARFLTRDGRAVASQVASEYSLGGLVVIGGNGSLTGAHILSTESDLTVVGVPGSIDNDIGLTREAIGVDTALNTIVDACDRISDTASSHRRAFIVEVMGRNCGYLAMAASVATGADAVLIPEAHLSDDEAVSVVSQAIEASLSSRSNKRRVLIIKAEGVSISTETLTDATQERFGSDVDVRATVLGHVVRGGRPSYRDRMLASRLGTVATEAVIEGLTDTMVAWNLTDAGRETTDPVVRLFGIEDVLAETKAMADGTSATTLERIRRNRRLGDALAA